MARRLPPRDAKGRFCEAKPPLLDPEYLKRLRSIVVDCTSYDNVLEALRPPRAPVWEEELR
jgi:hypothetical protein